MASPLEAALLAKAGPLSTSVISDAARQAVATQPMTPQQQQATPSGSSMKPALWAMGIGDGLDAASTIMGLHKGLQEGNPEYGSHPSIGRVLATKGADIGIGYLLNKLHDTHPNLARALAYASGTADTAAALHNFSLMRGK